MNRRTLAALALFLALVLAGSPALAAADDPGRWVTESDANTALLLELTAKYNPESATSLGLEGYESQITDLSRDRYDEYRADVEAAVATLRARLADTTDPRVRQDLEILVEAAGRQLGTRALDRKYFLPYTDVASLVYGVTRGMLDPRTPVAVRPFLVRRLNRYAGLEKGYRPITELARERTLERVAADPGLMGPYRGDLEQSLRNAPILLAGIHEELRKSGLEGWQKPYRALERQLAAYSDWVRADLLPRARTDHRLPQEVYADNLRNYGVDVPVDELVAKALTSFAEIRNEMQALATMIAAGRNWQDDDYRSVVRRLKEAQVQNDRLLGLYQGRLATIEGMIEAQRIVTLPQRPASIRLASAAESAQQPAPHMEAPRLINNTGQYGEFVLPLSLPPAPGGRRLEYDDFSHDAGTWTLIAHEARPGHELQYARLVEDGVSHARAIYAANSVNVEGWALYAEAELKPHLPLEGQLFALQHRMLRAARAFLDPMLNRGEISAEEAKRFLEREAVFSEAMATQEIERYAFRAPGQATSYFYGYQRLMETRQAAEVALGERFDRLAFNDFILRQGLLPPALLRKAVFEEFVPAAGAQPDAVASQPGG